MNISAWVATSGLALDLCGALLIGYEVFNRFKGVVVQRKGGIEFVDVDIPELTEQYKDWEAKKYRVMAVGLLALSLGFSLQIVAIWLGV